ncbi:MAG: glycoside hydrolase family 28 protein, partial [Duncaniella sp.]|nr:glycoside hydrolase family 28 protein [Duncaniella sp.]
MKKTIFTALLTSALMAFGAMEAQAAGEYARYYEGLPFETPVLEAPVIPDLTVSLTDFGGVGDGITLNTEAFAKAIDHLASRGGGHLNVPAGVWLTGPITLKSDIDLHIAQNALVVFSQDRSLFTVLPPDEGTVSKLVTAPINASHARNFSITGSGIIDGNGEVWRPVKNMKFCEWEWKKFLKKGGTLSD